MEKLKDKQWKEDKKILKLKLKTISEYEAEARKEFQIWIRNRDKDLPCISCGINTAIKWDAGHMYKANLYPSLMFDPDNSAKQCVVCNHHHGGKENDFRRGLIKRYGQEFINALDEKALYPKREYTKEELIEIKNRYKEMNRGTGLLRNNN